MEEKLPEFIQGDLRIGKRARRIDGKFLGVIVSVARYEGDDYFQLQDGALEVGGLERNQILIEGEDKEY